MGQDLAAWEFERRRRQRRRRTRVLTTLLFVCVAVGLAIGSGQSLLRLKAITVMSSDLALAEEVSQKLVVPANASLLTTDVGRLVDQAETCPRVARVEVQRRLPHRLLLTVVPREPILALRKQGRYLLVDGEGACLYWTVNPSPRLLRIEGLPEMDARVGQRVGGVWFDRGLSVATALSEAQDLGPWLMDASSPPELALVSGGGARGIVGTDGDLGRRARLFAELLAQLQGRGQEVGRMELRAKNPVWWPPEADPGRTDRQGA